MSKHKSGLTKQGLRNLDLLPGKSSGRVLQEPPIAFGACSHPRASRLNQVNDKTGASRVLCGSCEAVIWEGGK